MKVFLVLFICAIANAETKTNLFKKPEQPTPSSSRFGPPGSSPHSGAAAKHNISKGNLPSEFKRRGRFVAEESPIVLPLQKGGVTFGGLKIGEVIEAQIPESLFAFYDSKIPVRAIIATQRLKGAVLVGEASLERNSKRIVIEFKRFRLPNTSDIWQLVGSTLDSKGILGLKGEVVSNEATYFTAEIISALAAGYTDATIQRSQNQMGNYIEVPSTDTINKKAATAALAKTSDRFAEKLKASPEYSILQGPINIQVLITEEPRLQ